MPCLAEQAKVQQLIDEVVGLLGGSESVRRGERFSEAIGELVEESLLVSAHTCEALERTSDYRIRKAMKHFDEQPCLHHDFRQVARNVGLSRSRFFEQFKRSVGIAPTMYVDGLVVERAIALLVDSDCRIDEISASLGFAAQSSFSRFFKERVGFSPPRCATPRSCVYQRSAETTKSDARLNANWMPAPSCETICVLRNCTVT